MRFFSDLIHLGYSLATVLLPVTRLFTGHIFYHSHSINERLNNVAEVGSIVNKQLEGYIPEIRTISPRAAFVITYLSERHSLKVFQVYVPTIDYEDEVTDTF